MVMSQSKHHQQQQGVPQQHQVAQTFKSSPAVTLSALEASFIAEHL